MKIPDIIAIAFSALLGVAGILYSFSGDSGATCVIHTPEETYRYSLKETRTLTVTGVVGKIKIEITNGGVHIIEAACPNQICRLRGMIYHSGDSLVCAPNHVSVKIESDKQEVDAVTE